jgi:peroxiredoxin Q/BCP
MLTSGDPAPDFTLDDQHGNAFTLSSLRGRRVLIYFYPKADTPGCTQQTCNLRDIAAQVGDTAIVGISPDAVARQLKFATKYEVPFPLLADTDHAVAEAYSVWTEKKNYGRTYMGILRSSFLVAADGTIEHAWYKISPKDTPTKLLAALGAA